MREVFAASAELKFVGEAETGEVTGYASVFNVLDSHGDLIIPGAFDATLSEHKSSGRTIPMFAEHSFAMFGGDSLPIGKWTQVEPDEKGLRVTGKFIGLKHPDVARAHELAKENMLGGISIAYRVRDGGATKGKKAGEPLRTLSGIDLFSIDLVGDPSNPLARIDGIKAILSLPDHKAAAAALEEAMQVCQESLTGGDAPTSDERGQIADRIRTAYRHVTGGDMPAKHLQFEQLREMKKWLREQRGFSNSQADEIAKLVFKSTPRDEDSDSAVANAARKEAVANIRTILSGFSLNS